MNLNELYDKFLILEEHVKTYKNNFVIKNYWEIIRFKLFYTLSIKLNILSEAHKSSYDFKSVYQIFNLGIKQIKHFITKNPFWAKQKEYFFFCSPRRKKMDDGLFWDIHTDYYIDLLGENNCNALEYPYRHDHFSPPKTKNLYYLDIFFPFFLQGIGLLIIKFYNIFFSNKIKEDINQLNKYAEEIFNVEIDINYFFQEAKLNNIIFFSLYKRILKKMNPKIVFLYCSYGKEEFIRACRVLKIPTIEIQHGVINQFHMGYSYPLGNKMLFPDYFFSFGDFWLKNINLPCKKENQISVGFPHLEKHLKKLNSNNKANNILFISQGTIGIQLSQFAQKFAIQNQSKINIFYKLHPGEIPDWKSKYPWLIKTNIQIIDTDVPSLYELFSICKWQVGVSSTALYEGIAFGCQTYILNITGAREYMKDLIDMNMATLIENVNQIDINNHIDVKINDRIFQRFNMSLFVEIINKILQNSLSN